MKRPGTKIVISLLVYILSLTSQACILEQAIAVILHVAPHAHDTVETSSQSPSTSSHKHDEAGQENEFCCDNNLNLYIKTKTSFHVDWIDQPYSESSMVVADLEQQRNSFQHNDLLHRIKSPNSPRARDQYALSCLLHAPPRP